MRERDLSEEGRGRGVERETLSSGGTALLYQYPQWDVTSPAMDARNTRKNRACI